MNNNNNNYYYYNYNNDNSYNNNNHNVQHSYRANFLNSTRLTIMVYMSKTANKINHNNEK